MAETAAAVAKAPDQPSPANPAPQAQSKAKPESRGDGSRGDAGRAWPDKAAPTDPTALAKPLAEDRCKLLEFMDPGFHVTLEHGTPYDKVFEPAFWANVVRGKRMQPGHRIRVTNDEMSFFAWLVVFSCGANWAVVAQESYVARDDMHRGTAPEKQAAQHSVLWSGPVKKFRIVRIADQAEIRAGFDSEAEANRFLDDYLRRIGR